MKRRCPYCGRHLEKRITGHKHLPYTRLKCPGCGLEMDEPVEWVPALQGKPHDPFFGLPLWFVATVRGEVLWAYNRKHLSFLKRLVRAALREQESPFSTLSNRLPKWMLDRKNRSHVLKAISRLEKTSP